MNGVRIVVFEGIDRSGKSTLRKRFSQITGERYVTLARFLLSNAVYDIVFGRTSGPGVGEYIRAIEHMERRYRMLTVFVDTSPEVCHDRDPDGYSVHELVQHRKTFLSLMGKLPSETRLRLVTESKNGLTRSVEDLAEEVRRWVEGR